MKNLFFLFVLSSLTCAFTLSQTDKPTLFLVGDSTVKNGNGRGNADSLWGWGSVIQALFDTNKMAIQNHAIGGRSSRTFITEKRWEKVMAELKAGDFVLIQFGHNDGGALDDTARARGSIRGIGDSIKEIYNPIRKVQETVHTYGWYMRQYVKEAKAKGATPIICSLVPRSEWTKDNKIKLSLDSYALWAQQIATEEGAFFIDLNKNVALAYEKLGKEEVLKFFPKDHTHTNLAGAKLNAQIVTAGMKELEKCELKKYLYP
ncbi:MAG: rhamnogalacturonan acetylesterase [Saprospiraceae bacterium]|nr:rhamnogalacturonan acetylesterase [Saprospiraceae bacterium]